MAIEYGAYSGRARFGIDTWYEGDPNSGAVTVQWRVYLQTDRGATPGYSGTYTLVRTGSGPTGSGAVSVYTQGTTPQLLWSGSQSVSTSYTGTVYRDLGVYFTSALFDGGTPSHVRGIAIPQRAPSLPSPATSASATYVSDSRIDVSWVRPANAGDAATRWDNVSIDRWRRSTATWVGVAWLPGSATSWADTTVTADDEFVYTVYGWNPSGLSGPTGAGTVATTPDAPTAVSAAKNAAGNIVVTWQDNSVAETSFEVQGETTTLGTPTASPYTHVSPSTLVTHRYRVRAIAAGPRYSAWSAYSNTVQLLAAPAAPSNLSPNGTTVALEDALVLSWAHNPVDSTPQTAYELQHRLVGAGSWTTVTGTTAQTRTLTDYASQSNVEWQVRTKGQHADWSPWSALATFTTSAKPTASLSAPGASVEAPSTDVTWGYFHAGGNAQTGWEAQILSGAQVIAAGSGAGATSTWTSPNVLADDGTYTARVRVRAANGLWSEWDSQAFTVSYLEPALSSVTAAWRDGYGNVALTVAAVSESGKPATTSHRVERSIDGGNTWVTVADDLGTDVALVDWQSPAGGTFHYRVTTFSALPSSAASVHEVTVPATRVNDTIWISGGPGYALACAIPHNPELTYDGGRERTLHTFAGRTLPVEFSARQAPVTLAVSGTFMPDHYTPSTGDPVMATREQLEDIFGMPGPHLYRDPLGRVMYGTVSALRWSREPGGTGSVSFTITRSAPPSEDQAASMLGFYAPRIAEVAPGLYEVINADVVEAEPGVFEEIG